MVQADNLEAYGLEKEELAPLTEAGMVQLENLKPVLAWITLRLR